MRTEAQLNASRTNGSKSRGPVTAAGKRNSSRNSTQHGIFAKQLLLCTESRADFDEHAQTIYDEFQPETAFELSLVQNMIAASWRQMRLQVMEQALMNKEIHRQAQNPPPETMPPETGLDEINAAGAAESFDSLSNGSRTLELMGRYESRMYRQYLRSQKRLVEVQDRRRRTPPPATPAPVIPIRVSDSTAKTQDGTRQPAENEAHAAPSAAFPQIFIRVHSCSFVAKESSEPPATPPTPGQIRSAAA